MSARTVRLDPKINQILFVKNMPYKATAEEIFDLFGKYGAIRQVRVGDQPNTTGSAFIVYEDIFDAKNACDHLNGYQFHGRFLTVVYFTPKKKTVNLNELQSEVDSLKKKVEENDSDDYSSEQLDQDDFHRLMTRRTG